MYFNNDKISMYYKKYGTKKDTIIILPGWGNTRNTFNHIINYFKDRFTIYIFDYPGFGNSNLPNNDLTIYDYALFIINFMEEKNIDNPILIAHSFGGRIATLLTGYYKEKIDKQILIDIAGIKQISLFKLIKQTIYKLLNNIIKIFPNKNILQKKLLKLFASNDYNNLDKEMYTTFKNIVNEDLTNYYKDIDCDTLLIWGKLDIDTPLKDAIKMNKLINNSELIIYKDANHYSYLQYPYLTNRIIEEYIKNRID